jgi:hypothetical protein
MFCPNCTTQISTGHRYCRSCGVNLREMSLELGGERSIDVSAGREETKTEQVVSPSIRVWRRGFYCGVLGLVVVWLVPGLGMVLLFFALCLMLSSYFVRDRSPRPVEPASSTKELPVKLPAPSVTERTTNLFEGPGQQGPPANLT